MLTREDIGELARFESPEGCAISFYYQPDTPQDKSHRQEVILVKDLIRDALRRAERIGKNGVLKSDLERIQTISEHLHGNGRKAKAIFACGSRGIWKEFDVPPRLMKTELHMNSRFHLRPLSAVANTFPRVGVMLVDRTKARVLELTLDEMHEQEKITWELPRRGKSDGWFGFDAGHAERKVENETMRHFKELADLIKDKQDSRGWDKILIGCRDETWPEVNRHLHSYTKQKLVTQFPIDPVTATSEQVKTEVERILAEHQLSRTTGLIREVIGESERNARGVLGLRRTLGALERGEVQSLLIGRDFKASVSECRNCGHLDTRMVKQCAACGGETSEVTDVSDVLLSAAMRNGIEVVHVDPDLDTEFHIKGGVGALLRFRADQNTNEALQKAG